MKYKTALTNGKVTTSEEVKKRDAEISLLKANNKALQAGKDKVYNWVEEQLTQETKKFYQGSARAVERETAMSQLVTKITAAATQRLDAFLVTNDPNKTGKWLTDPAVVADAKMKIIAATKEALPASATEALGPLTEVFIQDALGNSPLKGLLDAVDVTRIQATVKGKEIDRVVGNLQDHGGPNSAPFSELVGLKVLSQKISVLGATSLTALQGELTTLQTGLATAGKQVSVQETVVKQAEAAAEQAKGQQGKEAAQKAYTAANEKLGQLQKDVEATQKALSDNQQQTADTTKAMKDSEGEESRLGGEVDKKTVKALN
ncbi:hypothetical protein Neosp_015178 [[Neocosmospora] mangrovei]